MTGTVVGVIGAGGFGRDIMPDVARICQDTFDSFEIYYVEENISDDKKIDNYRVMEFKTFLNLNRDRRYVIAIANSGARERIDLQCALSGARPIPVAHNSVSIFDTARISEGSILCAFTFVGPDVEIGKQFHGNIYSYVEHDCSIGNYVTFAPRASCNGNIKIEDHAYIGAGAIIRQGSSKRKLIIGQGAIIGMGAVVLNDVPPYTTVIGNPARILKNKI